MHWMKISLILCTFGLFKDFRPSESFVTDYLTGPWKNFTDVQVNQEIYPVSTYAYFATLVLVFLITDLLRYKPIIIVCSLSGAITFTLMLIGKDIVTMQILEFFYGLFLSAEVAYYTYIYAKVDKTHYQEVTGHTKAASLIGRCTAGVVAQLTTSFHILDYHQLNYITLAAFLMATIWAFFLPSVGQSIYFHRQNDDPENPDVPRKDLDYNSMSLCNSDQEVKQMFPQKQPTFSYKIRKAYFLLWKDFLQGYSNPQVVKWSIWWALSTCGFLQVSSYIQLLWQDAVEPGADIYNGAVDSAYALIGAITVFGVGKLHLNWTLFGDVTVSLFSFVEGVLLIWAAFSYDILILYVVYVIFGIVYHTMVTVASFEVAKYISQDSYGLIFGINIFFALLAQSILTAIVVNGSLTLDIRSQYLVYGGYFMAIASVYSFLGALHLIKAYKNGEKFSLLVDMRAAQQSKEKDDEKSSNSETLS